MVEAAAAVAKPKHHDNHSLIDELNAALASGGDDERRRILERVADLFAAGSRGYSTQQIALFDDVLQNSAPTSKSKRGPGWHGVLPRSTTHRRN
jgi:hypothetical protein